MAVGLVAEAQSRTSRRAPPGGSASLEVVERSIEDLQRDMAAGRTTARAIAAAHLARMAAYDKQGPALNAMIALNPRALDEADALDRERRERGRAGRCTASRSSSRTTTRRETCRPRVAPWRWPAS